MLKISIFNREMKQVPFNDQDNIIGAQLVCSPNYAVVYIQCYGDGGGQVSKNTSEMLVQHGYQIAIEATPDLHESSSLQLAKTSRSTDDIDLLTSEIKEFTSKAENYVSLEQENADESVVVSGIKLVINGSQSEYMLGNAKHLQLSWLFSVDPQKMSMVVSRLKDYSESEKADVLNKWEWSVADSPNISVEIIE